MRHKNVFLYGYYGFDNFGDELLLRAISERIFRSNQNIKFFVRSLNEVTVVSEKIQSTCVDTILLKKKNWLLKAGIYIKELLYWCRKSDELWIGGGGLFLDKGRVNIHLIFLFLICLYINKVKRCPIHILGVSFDYLTSPISIWITKNILTLATSVSIRDPLSCAYANQISGLTTTLSEDLIFVSDYIKNELPPTKENGYVGLSFVDYFGAYKFKNALSEKFDQSLKKYILSFPLETKFKYFVFQSTIGLNDKKYLDFILSLNRTHHFQLGLP